MIVVTGATGQLGRLVVENLLARGVDPAGITATGRTTKKLADLAARGVHTARADFQDRTSLDLAFTGADAVLIVSTGDIGNQVPLHTAAVQAADAAGAGRIVYTSALRADATPLILAPEHLATEQVIKDSGIPFTILRNGWYIENYLPDYARAKETGVVLGSVGTGRVAAASRADYAAAAAEALIGEGHQGRTYELSGDVALSYDELAVAFSEVAGREVTYQDVDPAEQARILGEAGLDEQTVGFVVALDGNIRDGALEPVGTDLSQLIGRPTTPFVDGLRAAVQG